MPVDLSKIMQIESNGNPEAFHPRTGATGLYQITPIVLVEYNNFHPVKYTKKDLKNPIINTLIAEWYMLVRIPEMMTKFGIPLSTGLKIIAWNWGINNLKTWYFTLPPETRNFLVKYYGKDVP